MNWSLERPWRSHNVICCLSSKYHHLISAILCPLFSSANIFLTYVGFLLWEKKKRKKEHIRVIYIFSLDSWLEIVKLFDEHNIFWRYSPFFLTWIMHKMILTVVNFRIKLPGVLIRWSNFGFSEEKTMAANVSFHLLFHYLLLRCMSSQSHWLFPIWLYVCRCQELFKEINDK